MAALSLPRFPVCAHNETLSPGSLPRPVARRAESSYSGGAAVGFGFGLGLANSPCASNDAHLFSQPSFTNTPFRPIGHSVCPNAEAPTPVSRPRPLASPPPPPPPSRKRTARHRIASLLRRAWGHPHIERASPPPPPPVMRMASEGNWLGNEDYFPGSTRRAPDAVQRCTSTADFGRKSSRYYRASTSVLSRDYSPPGRFSEARERIPADKPVHMMSEYGRRTNFSPAPSSPPHAAERATRALRSMSEYGWRGELPERPVHTASEYVGTRDRGAASPPPASQGRSRTLWRRDPSSADAPRRQRSSFAARHLSWEGGSGARLLRTLSGAKAGRRGRKSTNANLKPQQQVFSQRDSDDMDSDRFGTKLTGAWADDEVMSSVTRGSESADDH